MNWIGILYALVTAALMLWIIRRSFPEFNPKTIAAAFTLKVLSTFILLALFTYYYTDRSTSDIHRFFDDGLILQSIALNNPLDYLKILLGLGYDKALFTTIYFDQMNAWIKPFDSGLYNDNHIMIKLNSLLAMFSLKHEEVHAVWFTFLSFLGTLWIIRSIVPKPTHNLALILVSLLPSYQLWMSAGLKESLLLFGFGLLLAGWYLKENSVVVRTVMLIAGSIVLFQVKLYFLVFLIPGLIIDTIVRQRQLPSYWKPIATLGIFFSAFLILQASELSLIEYVVRKQHEFINHMQEINPGSGFQMEKLNENILGVVLAFPLALVNVLVRPLPWNITALGEWLLFAENLLFWGFLLWVIFKSTSLKSLSIRWWIWTLVLPILILIGLVTPVFGAIMRYRAPVLLLIIVAVTPAFYSILKPKTNA